MEKILCINCQNSNYINALRREPDSNFTNTTGVQNSNGQITCQNPTYFGSVVTPSIFERLPNEQSVAGKIVNYLSNGYKLLKTINNDLCLGRLSEVSAKEGVEFIARGSASAMSLAVGAKLTLLGSVFGPVGAACGALTGVALLAVTPHIAAKVANSSFNFLAEILQKTKTYLLE